jgi:four helix bundle protein
MESDQKKNKLNTRCYKLSISIIKLCDDLPNRRSSWVISDQLIRSSTSIGANVFEAKSSSSKVEFKKYFEIALKSANETIYWLNLLKDLNLTDSSKINILIQEVTEIGNILGRSVITLKKNIKSEKQKQ